MNSYTSLKSSCAFPGFETPSRALWPVWKDSARNEVPFHPLSKKRAAQIWHDVRRFERQTRKPGQQDGAIGRNGLAILYAMLFDALDHATGRLDPSYATLARLANISIRSVHRGLCKLKAAGVVHWVRRCIESLDAMGRFSLAQDTNAYGIQGESQWRGFAPRLPAPPPLPGTWGDHPPLPLLASGDGVQRMQLLMEGANGNPLWEVAGRLGRRLFP